MIKVLQTKERVARKEHHCNYCGEKIKKDEKYEWSKLTNGDYLYEWKSHHKCNYVANKLWEFIDPDEGMSEVEFKDGCVEFMHVYLCSDCNDTYEDCFSYQAVNKIYDYFKRQEG